MSSKRRVLKMPRTRDSDEWLICLLGQRGGFSRKGIAKRIFNYKRISQVSDADVQVIQKVLTRNGIKLWDWRNLESDDAVGFAATVEQGVEPKKKRKKKAG